MVSSASSCPRLWPAAAACPAANSGHSTISPNIDGPGSGASGRPPGSSSSIGKLITSVGPGRSIHRMCRSAIAAVSSSTIESSAAGVTFILRMTNLATLTSSSSETSMPDSLDTSMLTPSPSRSTAGGAPLRPIHQGIAGLRLFVRVDDFGDQPMPDNVCASEFGEVDIVDAVEDLHHRTQARGCAAGQIYLRDVAGDDDLRAKAQAGQEHLHLLARAVLRLVEDDERIIERVVREEEVLGDIERVRRSDLDAHGFLGARWLDSVNETHWLTAAGGVVLRYLAGEPEWGHALWQTDVEDVCVGAVVHPSTMCQSRLPSLRFPGALVHNTAERLDQERHIITQAIGGSPKLNAACSPLLSHRTTVRVEETLQNCQPHIGRIEEVVLGDELHIRPRSRQPELTRGGRDRVRDRDDFTGTSNPVQHVVDLGLASHLDPRNESS